MRLFALVCSVACAMAAAIHPSPSAAQAPRSAADKIAPGVLATLASGAAADVILELDSTAAAAEARRERIGARLGADDARIRALRISRHRALKQQVAPAIDAEPGLERLRDYDALAMLALRVRDLDALLRIASRPEVLAVHENRPHTRDAAADLVLIGQPATTAAGLTATGATIAVIDDGVYINNAAFGCTAPGVPASCRIAASVDFVTDTPPADDKSHGTNVAAIVLGVAPGARVASLDVFNGSSAFTVAILDAINWAISHQTVYNIAAINMSLGDSSNNASACDATSPFAAPLQQARDAGMLAAVASGNNGYLSGISGPACVSAAVSVGAVYDSAYGAVQWSTCTDAATAADTVTCFSNSSPALTLLAPGAIITAGGYTFGGTSQAAPHVAGAIAVLRAAFPSETPAQTVARLTANGAPVVDARNGRQTPRLALAGAARPVNDDFARRTGLVGATGTVSTRNVLATAEPEEPAHAGALPAVSLWWSWTAPSDGQARIDTAGSAVDTRLAVYSGTAIDLLSPVASNDDASGLGSASRVRFQAVAGSQYQVAVDANAAATGAIALNWALDPSALADLSVTLASSPHPVAVGADLTYTMTVANAGPQSATNVLATLTLSAGETLKSLPPGCLAAGAVVTCQVAELVAGDNVVYIVVATVSAAGSLQATASVAADTPDGTSANNASGDAVVATAPLHQVPMPAWSLALLAAAIGGATWRQARRGPPA